MAAVETIIGIFGTLITILKWTWWLIIIIAMFALKKKYERYPIQAIIFEKRGENLIKTNDRIGRVFDKYSGITHYRLKKMRDDIPVFNFEWILHNADRPTTIFEKMQSFLQPTTGTAILFRYGSKQYKPIKVGQKEGSKLQLTEVKDKKGNSMYHYSYGPFDPRTVIGVLDFEVVDWDNMNFMVQEQRASVVRRAKKGDFFKQFGMAALILGVTALVALLILKYSSDAGAALRAGQGAAPQDTSGGVISGAIDSAIPTGDNPPGA